MERSTEAAKPSLLHKLEGSTNEIHAAVIIPGGWINVLALLQIVLRIVHSYE